MDAVAGSWPTVPLGELVDPKRGITYGIVQPGEHVEDGVPIVRVSDLRGDRLNVDKPLRVKPEIEVSHQRTRLRGGELIMSIVGTVGQTTIVDQSLVGWNVARAIAVIPVKPEIGAYWIRLCLRSGPAKEHIDMRLNTTVQATLNLRDLANLPIVLPPEFDRKAISSTLGALDDKIELNRRMNETLEAMARALFRDWFVDFGPTRAKMEGRTPYLAPDLWSLFPDRLDDEGKPEGWEVGKMSDLFTLQRGFDLPSQDRRDGPYQILAASGPNGFHDAFMVKGPGVTTGRSGVLGKVFYIHEDFWPLNTSLWVKEYHRATPRFAYFLLELMGLEGFNAGSAVPTLNRNHVHGLPTVLPPVSVVHAFDRVAESLMARQRKNEQENETLAQTRDLLLPRLMSGEIRV